MRKIILDMNPIRTREAVHEYLAMQLDLPDYYGNNLDALYDCLTDLTEDTCVGFFEPEEETELGSYLHRVKLVMRDAEAENPHFAVIFSQLEENYGEEG